MFPRAVAARAGFASSVISMPSGGSARAIQIAEYPMQVPISSTRLAPVAITSECSRRAEAGWHERKVLSASLRFDVANDRVIGHMQPVEVSFHSVVDDLAHGEPDCKLTSVCATPRSSRRSGRRATPMPCSTS